MSKKHNSWAYYCDECLNEIRKEVKDKVLEDLKLFALGLNGEDHVDTAIKNCPCDACRIIKKIIEEEQKNK